MQNINRFQTIISEFAKVNKISRVKLEQFTSDILSQAKPQGKQGRPMLEKTGALHAKIIEQCKGKEIDAVTLRNAVGSDSVVFNNALTALIKQGKIIRVGKAKTGKKGRQPFILKAVE